MTRFGNSDLNKKSKNSNKLSQEDDYKALIDKLVCPACKAEQSFDEYFEKIRECRRCNEKYTKAKISNAASFEKKNKENEEKRLLKLKSVEAAVYGNLGL
jgi:ribosomal protein L37AE/L43A